MGESRGRRRRPTRVGTRLVALVLVPVVGLTVFGGREAYGGARVAAHASELERRVGRASTLLELTLALANETFSSGALTTAARFGMDA